MNLTFDYDKEPRREILCIDCRSFYASVECVALGKDPLTTKLVVMSYPSADPQEEGSGLILASSPAAKAAYGISNVSRARDLPFPYPEELYRVAPRMRLYMEKNREINRIYKTYADENNHHVYSVDESFLDVTNALTLFHCQNAFELAKIIKEDVYRQTGIYTSVGIGDNPLLAKLALDNEAKHAPEMIATWRYEDVPQKLWGIASLTDFWGIGKRTARRLQLMGITSIAELAQSNYYVLKERLGLLGAQLYAHAWGIDRSFLGEMVPVKSHSLGNSQVLPRDYEHKNEIEVVLKEMADQVATRLRRQELYAQTLHLGIGFSLGYREKGESGFHQQTRVTPTSSTREIAASLLLLFRRHYHGQPVRNISVSCGDLIPACGVQLDLFQDPQQQVRQLKVDFIVDKIRQKYGFKSILHANSLLVGGRAIARSSLVGGHAGGMSGLDGAGEEDG